MGAPRFNIGQTVYFIYDYYIDRIEIKRIINEGNGWRYEPDNPKFPSSQTTYEPFATRKEAKAYRLKLIDEAVEEYKKELVARKKNV